MHGLTKALRRKTKKLEEKKMIRDFMRFDTISRKLQLSRTDI